MGAVNARRVVVTEYGFDPNDGRGLGLASNIWRRVQSTWATRYGVPNGDPGGSFTGYLSRSAPFLGNAAALGGNANSFRNNAAATIDTGLIEGPMGDPARRIFAQRMARQTGGAM